MRFDFHQTRATRDIRYMSFLAALLQHFTVFSNFMRHFKRFFVSNFDKVFVRRMGIAQLSSKALSRLRSLVSFTFAWICTVSMNEGGSFTCTHRNRISFLTCVFAKRRAKVMQTIFHNGPAFESESCGRGFELKLETLTPDSGFGIESLSLVGFSLALVFSEVELGLILSNSCPTLA